MFTVLRILDFSWQASLAIALAMAMSSTAIVLQSLKEKGLMDSQVGRYSFGVLLFQDISVIPILAILPLLAVAGPIQSGNQDTWIDGQPGWIKTLAVFTAVALVVAAGRFLVVPLLRMVARTRLRELFTASSLLLVVAIALLMQQVGLSPALGTFLAGVVLANSEFKHELESDLEPFKGLLLGLFFLAVGASINFHLVGDQPLRVIGYVIGVMVVKALVLFLIGRRLKLSTDRNLLFAISLSQIGEFAFVLFSFIFQLNILDQSTTDLLMAVTALSMTITPILLLIFEKWIQPAFGAVENEKQEADVIDEKHQVILAGFSDFGATIGRFLRANGVNATILDNDPDRVDLLRKMGFKVFYGDATRMDLLESAGIESASLFISAISSIETNVELVKTLKRQHPDLPLMVRARNRFDAYELIDLDAGQVYRETLESSIRMGVDVLKKLGLRGYSAYRAGQNFIRYDEAAMNKLGKQRHDMKQYILSVREQIAMQEELLNIDRMDSPNSGDHAWDSQQLRETLTEHPGS